MRTGVGLHAAPELRGFNEDLAEYYNLPRFGIGGVSGSKNVDQQAALEAALTLLTSTWAGAQLIHDVGYMDNGKTGALDQLVICHEIIGWIKQYMKDISINEETLALDLIDEVVRKDGDFLQTEHTLRHFKEDFYPELLDRHDHGTWQAQGGQSLRNKARKKVDELLREHQPIPLPAATIKELQAIADEE